MKNEVTQLEDLKAVEKVLTKEKYDIYEVYKLIGMRLFPNTEINGAEDTENLIERTIDLITLLKTDNIILETKEKILDFFKFIYEAAKKIMMKRKIFLKIKTVCLSHHGIRATI